jgi:phosphoribosyl-ATP pyrophosphohydrolase/phosphoribosyl-AMP cyclohydrolase
VDIEGLKWDADALLPVVIADANTGAVLTLAWANREALAKTLASQQTHLYSRSRQALWRKGETSGHTQRVVEVTADCDGDALLYRVIPNGPACHTGQTSCFHQQLFTDPQAQNTDGFARAVHHVESILERRKTAPPEGSYVAKLYAGGVDRIGKKIGEEATEVVIAAKNDNEEELIWESADLIFHLLVLLKHRNISLDRVGQHLLSRAKPSDHDE